MIKNDFVKVLLLISVIFIVYMGFRNEQYQEKHPKPFAPLGWNQVEINDIKMITLSPLLSHETIQCLTIEGNIDITDMLLISDIWKLMQGKESARRFTDHWFDKEKLKITFHLLSDKKMSFRITFHAHKNVAEYFRMINPDSFYDVSGDADKGSPELYEIFSKVIAKSKINWVNSNKDCWNIDGPLTYVGCSD